MLTDSREPTLREALCDPIVRAVMKADGVDPAVLEADLRQMALKIGDSEAEPRRPFLNT